MKKLTLTAVLIGLMTAVSPAVAETIAVIGTGMMGGSIGPRMAELGHTIVYGSRDPASERIQNLLDRTQGNASAKTQEEAAAEGEIVFLAVPWFAAEERGAAAASKSGRQAGHRRRQCGPGGTGGIASAGR